MTVFIYTMRRLLRNKANLFMILLLTPLFIGFTYGLGQFGQTNITVGLVDLDNTPLTEMLAEALAETTPVLEMQEEDIRSTLAGSKADYILVIDSGFSAQTIAGSEPKLRGYSIQESNIAQRVIIKIEGFIGAAKSVAKTAQGDEAAFYSGMEAYKAGSFALESQTYSSNEKSVDSALGGLGLLSMSMMLLSTFTAVNLIRDRGNRTFFRVLASPMTLKGYMLQNILCFFLVLVMQVSVVFLVVQYIFGIYMGASALNLFLVMTIFALLCVAMGIALASAARTARQASTIASLIITPMSMLSGLFWPRSMMPEFLQIIGKYLPPTWVMEAAQKVMLGKSLASASLELSILLGFIVVFFLLGTWRRTDIAR